MKKSIYLLIGILLMLISINTISAYESYKIGDEVEYNNHSFHVIENSDEDSDTILLLLKDYVSYDELMELDIENKDQIASYGGFGYGSPNGSYEDSYIKTVVDAWSNKISLKPNHIKEARLIKYEDLINNLGYEESVVCTGPCHYDGSLDNVPDWFKNNESSYFTMSNVNDSTFIWMMSLDGSFNQAPGFSCPLKPVIRLYKSALTDTIPEESDKSEQGVINNNDNNSNVNNNEKKEYVSVPNTMQKISVVLTMVGIIIISISVFLIIGKKVKQSTK